MYSSELFHHLPTGLSENSVYSALKKTLHLSQLQQVFWGQSLAKIHVAAY